jgi:uncharacterized protein (DUF427 family)
MADKVVKIAGPDHPISIEANPSRIVVKIGGRIIADTSAALTLREASYPPVQYIPRRDVDMTAHAQRTHFALSLQGRRFLLRHSRRRRSFTQCSVDL